MRLLFSKIILCAILAGGFAASGYAAEPGWNEAGVRMGIQATPKHETFHQYEAFAAYGLPWDWRGSSGWGVSPQLNGSVGVLSGGDDTGFIGSVGTALVLDKGRYGFSTDLGINVNVLDRRQFGRQDFGSVVQFGAYLGVNYCFRTGLKIGYHIQHISNGHILYAQDTPNPGLDMHLIGISYAF